MALSESQIQINRSNLRVLEVDELIKLQEIELNAIASFKGGADELESALGFLRLGFQFGWKPLAIIHSKKTFKKYEQILGIEAKEMFPVDTVASSRSMGYKIASGLSNFWKAVSGDTKVENRREIGD